MITVTVTDAANGATLPGVAVVQLASDGHATGAGELTDGNGAATITPGRYSFQLLGYAPRDVQVNNSGTLPMAEAPETLDEFTFIGTRKRSPWPLYVLAAAVILDQQ